MENNRCFENFKDWVCSWCVNHNDNCDPLHNCDWEEDFNEALNLCLELSLIEDDPDCLFGTSEDDYNFEAQALAYNQIDSRLQELKDALVHDVQTNVDEYYKAFGYEM